MTFAADLALSLEGATHCWLGTAPCGCLVARFCDLTDTPELAEQTRRAVAQLERYGRLVRRVPLAEAEHLDVGCRCAPAGLRQPARRAPGPVAVPLLRRAG